jgi:hypothetical protein
MYPENKTSARRHEVYKEVSSTVKKHYGYLPFQWVYGYADFLSKGKRGLRFLLTAICLFFMYNITNPLYFAKFITKHLYRRIIQFVPAAHFIGKYQDNWVSKQYVYDYIVRNVATMIEVKGQHLWPMDIPLQINVSIDSISTCSIEVADKGHFVRTIRLDCALQPGLHELKLETNQIFVPAKLRLSADKRKLSFVLDRLELLP